MRLLFAGGQMGKSVSALKARRLPGDVRSSSRRSRCSAGAPAARIIPGKLSVSDAPRLRGDRAPDARVGRRLPDGAEVAVDGAGPSKTRPARPHGPDAPPTNTALLSSEARAEVERRLLATTRPRPTTTMRGGSRPKSSSDALRLPGRSAGSLFFLRIDAHDHLLEGDTLAVMLAAWLPLRPCRRQAGHRTRLLTPMTARGLVRAQIAPAELDALSIGIAAPESRRYRAHGPAERLGVWLAQVQA